MKFCYKKTNKIQKPTSLLIMPHKSASPTTMNQNYPSSTFLSKITSSTKKFQNQIYQKYKISSTKYRKEVSISTPKMKSRKAKMPTNFCLKYAKIGSLKTKD